MGTVNCDRWARILPWVALVRFVILPDIQDRYPSAAHACARDSGRYTRHSDTGSCKQPVIAILRTPPLLAAGSVFRETSP